MSCKGPQGTPCNVGKNSTFLDPTGKNKPSPLKSVMTVMQGDGLIGFGAAIHRFGKPLGGVQVGPTGTVAHYRRRSR